MEKILVIDDAQDMLYSFQRSHESPERQVLTAATLAEGIETHQQLEGLRAEGCNYGQGFLFAHPGPPRPEITVYPPVGAAEPAPDAEPAAAEARKATPGRT